MSLILTLCSDLIDATRNHQMLKASLRWCRLMMMDGMEPSSSENLSSTFIEECNTLHVWSTKGVFVDGYILNDNGKEEKVVLDICNHIGCDSSDTADKKKHLNEFQSRLKRGQVVKVYFSPEYNEHEKGGRKKMIKYIVNRFDASGGGGITATGQTGNTPSVRFQCFRYKVRSAVQKDTENVKSTSSSRPLKKEDTCQWRLNVGIEDKVAGLIGRFFFYMNGSGNRFHNGHVPKIKHENKKRMSPDRLVARQANPAAHCALQPQWESLCNIVGDDTELIEELRLQLHDFHVEVLEKQRSKSGNQTTEGGRARKSMRLEASPTGTAG